MLVLLPNPTLANPKMYVPLGILYLASAVKKAGFAIEITDMRGGETELPEARFYGFSCTTPEIKRAKTIAKKVKGKTIVGGAHPSLLPLDCIDFFDYTVIGEGEYVLPQILGGKTSKKLIGAKRLDNLDDISYPAWDLIEEPFSRELFPGERYGHGEMGMTVINSRGCPFQCSFCGNLFYVPVKYRSVSNIIGELEELKKRGVNYIRFEDDNFTIHPQFENLCLEIGRLNLRWKCHTRSRLIRSDNVSLMKWAGCEEMGLGVESADNEVLRINNKRETIEEHTRAVEIMHRGNLRVKTYMIAGLPGETDDTLRANQRFFERVKPDKWTLSTFTPYPGCPIYNSPESFNIEIMDKDFNNWTNFDEDHFVHRLLSEPQEKTWQRYKVFYAWLVREEWKK